jgi:hypothetical protein
MTRNKRSNSTQEIADALDTPVNLNWCDVAEDLNLSIPDPTRTVFSQAE